MPGAGAAECSVSANSWVRFGASHDDTSADDFLSWFCQKSYNNGTLTEMARFPVTRDSETTWHAPDMGACYKVTVVANRRNNKAFALGAWIKLDGLLEWVCEFTTTTTEMKLVV